MIWLADQGMWLFLLSLGMPGPVHLRHCDQSERIVGMSTHSMGDVRPTMIEDIKFNLDADAWERDRVADLLRWGQFCWSRHGCVEGGRYNPEPPAMKCPPGAPTS